MKQFNVPWAVFLGILAGSFILSVALLIGARVLGLPTLECMTATSGVLTGIGTIFLGIIALFGGPLREKIERPILRIIGPYEPTPPYLRRVPLHHTVTVLIDGQPRQAAISSSLSYQLSVQVKNVGKTTAKNAAILLSAMGWVENNQWQKREVWIPAPMHWALDAPADIGGEIPSEERDLTPDRAYVFNFAALRTDDPDVFILNSLLMPGNQERKYGPGEYCFEVTTFAERADQDRKYFCIKWYGDCQLWHFKDVEKKIEVRITQEAPW
jgi:hypothetical protein